MCSISRDPHRLAGATWEQSAGIQVRMRWRKPGSQRAYHIWAPLVFALVSLMARRQVWASVASSAARPLCSCQQYGICLVCSSDAEPTWNQATQAGRTSTFWVGWGRVLAPPSRSEVASRTSMILARATSTASMARSWTATYCGNGQFAALCFELRHSLQLFAALLSGRTRFRRSPHPRHEFVQIVGSAGAGAVVAVFSVGRAPRARQGDYAPGGVLRQRGLPRCDRHRNVWRRAIPRPIDVRSVREECRR